MLAETKTGPYTQSDGSGGVLRGLRQGGAAVGDSQGRYYENTFRGQVFSLVLDSTTSGAVVAGNLVGAAALAATGFILWNPFGSGRNLSLLKFGVAFGASTTLPIALYHGYMATAPTNATSVVTPISANNVGLSAASAARAVTSITSVALTGNSAPVILRLADINASAGTFAALGTVKTIEYIEGEIVIPPGTAWLPLWKSAGTAVIASYSVTWEEIPA